MLALFWSLISYLGWANICSRLFRDNVTQWIIFVITLCNIRQNRLSQINFKMFWRVPPFFSFSLQLTSKQKQYTTKIQEQMLELYYRTWSILVKYFIIHKNVFICVLLYIEWDSGHIAFLINEKVKVKSRLIIWKEKTGPNVVWTTGSSYLLMALCERC